VIGAIFFHRKIVAPRGVRSGQEFFINAEAAASVVESGVAFRWAETLARRAHGVGGAWVPVCKNRFASSRGTAPTAEPESLAGAPSGRQAGESFGDFFDGDLQQPGPRGD